ncbi:MAG: hypothetical protein U1G07_17275 [Verrucomicrobiota bacterium]
MVKALLALLSLAAFVFPSWADTHLYVGALNTNQNGKCSFSNGGLFDASASGVSLPQVLRTNGLNAGYFRGDALTFSALAATTSNGGPIPGAAALGARLAVQVVGVAGPPGGSFAFWEGDGESDLGNVTFSVPVGTTNGTNYVVISENHGESGADPYGHIHGRQFTTSAPGTYIVDFRVIDLSANGAGGGPIQSPSDLLPVRFQAGLRIESVQAFNRKIAVSFRSPPGISNQLESTDSMASENWQPAAAPLRGNNNLQTVTDTNGAAAERFYRIRQLNNLP